MENQIGFSRWPPLPRKLWKCYYFASSEAEWGKSKDIQSVCLKENECLCCSCTTRNLESRRLGLTLFITLWLESCSKFLAVFAAFADSPLSVCLCRKTSSCPNVQSRVRWTNVAGKRWNQTMNEQLKRSTSATHALAGAFELYIWVANEAFSEPRLLFRLTTGDCAARHEARLMWLGLLSRPVSWDQYPSRGEGGDSIWNRPPPDS